MRAVAPLLLLAACHRAEPASETPGGRLEAAAVARGLTPDVRAGSLPGVWASDTDRLCVVPAAGGLRIGASVDYGDGQGCAASGSVERAGDRLRVRFGACRFDARFDGERISFPPGLPDGCERFCSGRASLSAVAVERLSESASEAAAMRGPNGKPLCAP